MKSIFSWSADRSTLGISSEAQRLCDLLLDVDGEYFSNQLDFGSWWVLPFARTDAGDLVGLRLLPDVPPSRCPVVKLVGAEAVTLASRPAHLVPIALIWRMFGHESGWAAVADLPEPAWRELAAFHRALGGADDLRALRAVAADGTLRRYNADLLRHMQAWWRVEADVLARLDPAPETAVYRRYVQRAIVERTAPLPLPDGGAAWRPGLAAVAFVTNRGAAGNDRGDRRGWEAAAAWEMMAWPAVDAGRRHAVQRVDTDGTRAAKNGREAAQALLRRGGGRSTAAKSWKADPLWPAVVALAEQGESYDGAAHVRAAEELARSGQPERAYAALAAASFSAGAGAGIAPLEPLERAAALAKSAGWKAIVAAVNGWRRHHVPADQADDEGDDGDDEHAEGRHYD
jgi:hypothetical protein